MRSPSWRRGALAAVVLLAAACSMAGCREAPAGAPPASSVTPRQAGARQGSSALGTYIVHLETMPDPLPLNELFQVRVTVSDARTPQQPARDVAVEMDAVMPSHGHGMNTRPSGTWRGEAYVADGLLFHMPGQWQLWVDISRQGQSERARFDLELP